MTPSIHLFNPAIGDMGSNYLEFRCGRRVHRTKEKYLVTQNTEEVTCIKCKSYINNPLRILRRYGRITVIEGFSIVLNHDFGYKYDLVLTVADLSDFVLNVGQNSVFINQEFFRGDFSEMASKLAAYYEKNLIPLQP